MRILAIGCFHGKVPTDLKNFIRKEKIDVILFSGDFAEHRRERKFEHKHDKEIIERLLAGEDYFSIMTGLFDPKLLQSSAAEGLESTLKVVYKVVKLGVPVYWIHGNHDPNESELTEMGLKWRLPDRPGFRWLHRQRIKIDGVTIAGYGGYRGTTGKLHLLKGMKVSPLFRRKVNEIVTEQRKEMSALLRRKTDILMTHDPPANTKLDYLIAPGQVLNHKHIGDDVTRAVIERYRPRLVLCSHMHERRGIDKIGKTVVVNTGFGKKGEAVIIELPSLKVDLVKISGKKAKQ